MTQLYQSIIVPLDGSAVAERALPIAIALAERFGAVVRLPVSWARTRALHRRSTTSITLPVPWVRMPMRFRRSWWMSLQRGYEKPSPMPRMRFSACRSHGRSGLGSGVLGSVAESVLRTSLDPVLLVGPHARLEGDLHWETLLATFDGSSRSEAVLPLAADWAEALGMRLILANAIDPQTEKQMGGFDVLDTNYVKGLMPRIQRPVCRIGLRRLTREGCRQGHRAIRGGCVRFRDRNDDSWPFRTGPPRRGEHHDDGRA